MIDVRPCLPTQPALQLLIFNLSCLSEVVYEKVVDAGLLNAVLPLCQSVYRPFHSMETAVLEQPWSTALTRSSCVC